MKKGMGCNQCTHPTCENAFAQWAISDCGKCDFGVLVLDSCSAPNWKMDCNICSHIVRLPKAFKIIPSKIYCEFCEARQLEINFNKNDIPAFLKGVTEYTGCIFCDELLSEMAEEGYSKTKHSMFRRGRGKGRGRGRGKGRGRAART